jgi:uncharacterized membrane protein YedE/YeeE
MAKFMSFLLFLVVVILAAAGVLLHLGNAAPVDVGLPRGYALSAQIVQLLGGAFGVGVLFGWMVVWTRNLRRARKAAQAAAAEAGEEPSPELA